MTTSIENIKILKEFEGLQSRAVKVSFMECKEEGVFYRMKGFTDLPTSKETTEYERNYVDEEGTRTDTTGMSSATSFTLDKYKKNPVHEEIAEIFDKELIGNKAIRSLLVVDFSEKVGEGYAARMRKHTVVPDTEGDGTDAYNYSGTFKANGNSIEGYAVPFEGDSAWVAVKFIEGTPTEVNPEG